MEAGALALALAFVGIEFAYARRRGQAIYSPTALATDLACHALNLAVQFGIGLSLWLGYPALHARLALVALDVHEPLHWIVGLLVFDAVNWLRHRLAHQVELLWLLHGVHHESRDMNLGTAMRVSALQALQFLPFTPLMALCGLPLDMGLGLFALTAVWTFAHHTRLVDHLGPLEAVLVTPRHHRTHHAMGHVGANYGSVLIVWDRLFGTFVDRDTAEFGTPELAPEIGALEANLAPLRALVARLRATPSWTRRLQLFFANPHASTAPPADVAPVRVHTPLLLAAVACAHLPFLLPREAALPLAALAATLAILAVRGQPLESPS